MKKHVLFALFVFVVVPFVPVISSVTKEGSHRIIDSPRSVLLAGLTINGSTQGTSLVSNNLVSILIFLLLMIILVMSLIGLSIYLVIRWMVLGHSISLGSVSDDYDNDSNFYLERPEGMGLEQQIFLEQEWLWTTFLSRDQDDTDLNDPFDLPTDWSG